MTAATLLAIAIVVGRWMFTGPGARRAYGDVPDGRAFRAIRHRRAVGIVDAAAADDHEDDHPARPSLPTGPRHSA
jgi:hypothetical protein